MGGPSLVVVVVVGSPALGGVVAGVGVVSAGSVVEGAPGVVIPLAGAAGGCGPRPLEPMLGAAQVPGE